MTKPLTDRQQVALGIIRRMSRRLGNVDRQLVAGSMPPNGIRPDELDRLLREIAESLGVIPNVGEQRIHAIARHIRSGNFLDDFGFAPFNFLDAVAFEPANPERLLSGLKLTEAEVADEYATTRRLDWRGKEIQFADVATWLRQQEHKVILLQASPGEGKSTFCTLLKHHLRSAFVVIEWDGTSASYPLERLQALARTVFEEDSGFAALPLLVIGELGFNVERSDLDRLARDLMRCASSELDVITLIAGRPNEIRYLLPNLTDVEVEPVRLQPLDVDEARWLVGSLRRAYESTPQVDHARYPNLERFLATRRQEQLAVFERTTGGLIVSLLKATYGEKFWERLDSEAERLPSDAMLAYCYVCLATASGSYVGPGLLLYLCGSVELSRYCELNPWALDAYGNHIARHPLIAQTVVEVRKSRQEIVLRCLQELLSSGPGESERMSLVLHIFDQIIVWEAVAPNREGVRVALKSTACQALANAEDLFAVLLRQFGDNISTLLHWARILHLLLPEHRHAWQESHAVLPAVSEKVLGHLEAILDDESPLLQRVQFYRERASDEVARCKGKGEAAGIRLERLRKWSRLTAATWASGDAHFAVLQLAIELVQDGGFKDDSSELIDCYGAGMLAFERLRMKDGDEGLIRVAEIMYSELIAGPQSGFELRLSNGSKEILIKEAWLVSAESDRPNHRTATNYAKRCHDDDEAWGILETVIRHRPGWAEAYYVLAVRSLRPDSSGQTRRRLDAEGILSDAVAKGGFAGLNLAIFTHATALFAGQPTRRKLLQNACSGYQQYAKSKLLIALVDGIWDDAIEELGRIAGEQVAQRQSTNKRLSVARVWERSPE